MFLNAGRFVGILFDQAMLILLVGRSSEPLNFMMYTCVVVRAYNSNADCTLFTLLDRMAFINIRTYEIARVYVLVIIT